MPEHEQHHTAEKPHDDENDDIDVLSFNELQLDSNIIVATQKAWTAFSQSKYAGESIFTAVFESSPSIQSAFKAALSVQAMRFMTTLKNVFAKLDDKATLKAFVETIACGHMHFNIKVEDVAVFRSSIVDLMSMELSGRFTDEAQEGVKKVVNYIGGALIHIRSICNERLRILNSSWQKANMAEDNDKMFVAETETDDMQRQISEGSKNGDETGLKEQEDAKMLVQHGAQKKKSGGMFGFFGGSSNNDGAAGATGGQMDASNIGKGHGQGQVQNVPTTYPDMFRFNAAVMGFGSSSWMNEVLLCFDNLVLGCCTDGGRFVEECDVLALRIAKMISDGKINLVEYKTCMLASLRSLLPKEWSPQHEVAWVWLWDSVQTRVQSTLKVAANFGKATDRFWSNLDEEGRYEVRKNIYNTFFTMAPAGQDYFKQSNTRLHFIADQVFQLSIDIFADPVQCVDFISGLGLRHVGYGIPTELFAPFVASTIDVLNGAELDVESVNAFKWGLGLIQRMLVRTIVQGSTIVMKAINVNTKEKVQKAIINAPRGQRAKWMLTVQVGSQSISPLEWAVESGRLLAAEAIIQDLLTFRADRERYYYGMEALFGQHKDIVQMLCERAPSLLPILLDGLIWRSRNTVNGIRRANYYVKYMVVRHDGGVSDALSWFAISGDVNIISHPVNVLVSDTMWKGIVRKHFLLGRVWFVYCLINFLVSQSILPGFASNADEDTYIRIIIFALRCITYVGSLMRLVYRHSSKFGSALARRAFRRKFGCIPVPEYLGDASEVGSFFLMALLVAMSINEPMIYCFESPAFPTFDCDKASGAPGWWYRVLSMVAMGMHWLLIVDMSVFSTKLSAFLLVCSTVLSEVSRFLVALAFLLIAFGSAIACLKRDNPDFADIPNASLSLFSITLLMMPRDYRELQYDPPLLAAVFIFVTASVIMLLNLLIAQLNCSYEFIYADMVGFARLNRATVIVESLNSCSQARWTKFCNSLKMDRRLEFNEGDVGIPGALQLNEPASMNVVNTEQIVRFGGDCSPEMPWPEDNSNLDRIDRMELLVSKVLKKVKKASGKSKKAAEAENTLLSGGASGLSGGASGLEMSGGHDDSDDGQDSFGSGDSD